MRIASFKKIFKVILLILLFGVFYFHFASGLNYHPLHEDEQNFVARSRLFDTFFLRQDLDNKDWQGIALDQPPLAYYIYGLTLNLEGYGDLAEEQRKIGFNTGYLDKAVLGWSSEKLASLESWWVRLQGNQGIADLPSVLMPSFKMIWQARKAAVAFSLGCLVLVYLLGVEIRGFATGILSALILTFNPLMLMEGKHAMADSILLFFLLANILLIIYALKSFYKKEVLKFLFFAFLVGINAALAASAKLNGGMALIIWGLVVFLVLVSILIKSKRRGEEILLLVNGFLISVLVASNLFVFLNPYLYSDPLSRSMTMIEHRILTFKGQQVDHARSALFSFPDKLKAVLSETLLAKGDWNNFEVPFLDLLFFLVGLSLLATIASRKIMKGKNVSSEMIIFVQVLVTFIALVSYIPLDWARYYLPLIPCIAITQAYGISRIGEFVWLKLKRGFS